MNPVLDYLSLYQSSRCKTRLILNFTHRFVHPYWSLHHALHWLKSLKWMLKVPALVICNVIDISIMEARGQDLQDTVCSGRILVIKQHLFLGWLGWEWQDDRPIIYTILFYPVVECASRVENDLCQSANGNGWLLGMPPTIYRGFFFFLREFAVSHRRERRLLRWKHAKC